MSVVAVACILIFPDHRRGRHSRFRDTYSCRRVARQARAGDCTRRPRSCARRSGSRPRSRRDRYAPQSAAREYPARYARRARKSRSSRSASRGGRRRGRRSRRSKMAMRGFSGTNTAPALLVPHPVSGGVGVIRSAPVTPDPVLSGRKREYINSMKSLGAGIPIVTNNEMTPAIAVPVAFLVLLSCWTLQARPQPILRDLVTEPAVLTVGPGKKFSTIATAVAAARNSDTIEVQAGTYIDDYVSINKNITLQGVGGTVEVVSTGLIPN